MSEARAAIRQTQARVFVAGGGLPALTSRAHYQHRIYVSIGETVLPWRESNGCYNRYSSVIVAVIGRKGARGWAFNFMN